MNNNQKEHLTGFLRRYAAGGPVRFHMPGHKGKGELYARYGYGDFLGGALKWDITEIPGADDLFHQEGVLKDLSERYRRLYGCKKSYPLVNGSSCGLIAAVLASVPRGEGILLARNCHKSVYNGAELAGAVNAYVYPEILPGWDVAGSVGPEEVGKALDEHPETAAVVITSPNYYGIQSDISAIAEIVHKKGKILIVDQAHGAHFPFFQELKEGGEEVDFPCLSAERQGADLVISSLHKTMASLGQTALLNVCTDRVPTDLLEQALQVTQTSSPSYLLTASMDINAGILEDHAPELMHGWNELTKFFYTEAEKIPGLEVMREPMQDLTKFNVSMRRLGLNAVQLQDEMMERGVFPEFAVGDIVMCLTGIGTGLKDVENLLFVLRNIAEKHARACDSEAEKLVCERTQILNKNSVCTQYVHEKEQRSNLFRLSTKEHGTGREKVAIQDACGRVCASPLIPYPPGIPTICRSEQYTSEVIESILKIRKRGEEVQGLDEDGRVFVFL